MKPVLKKLPTTERPEPDSFTSKFLQEVSVSLQPNKQKRERRKRTTTRIKIYKYKYMRRCSTLVIRDIQIKTINAIPLDTQQDGHNKKQTNK